MTKNFRPTRSRALVFVLNRYWSVKSHGVERHAAYSCLAAYPCPCCIYFHKLYMLLYILKLPFSVSSIFRNMRHEDMEPWSHGGMETKRSTWKHGEWRYRDM